MSDLKPAASRAPRSPIPCLQFQPGGLTHPDVLALVLGVFSQLKTLSFAQLENILGPMFLLGLGGALAVGGGAALMLRTPTFRVIAMRHVDPDEIRRAA